MAYKKIVDFGNGKDFTELEQGLYVIQRSIGVSQLIGEYEMERLMNFLMDEFDDFNLLEIDCAINLANAGHISVKENGNPYGSFTPLYLAGILQPYRQHRLAIVAKHNNETNDMFLAENRAPAKEPTPEEIVQADKAMINTCYQSFLTGSPTFFLDKVYDKAYGIYSDLPYFNEFTEKAIEVLRLKSKKDKRVKEIIQAFDQRLDFGVKSVTLEAKKLAILSYFTQLQNKEVKEIK